MPNSRGPLRQDYAARLSPGLGSAAAEGFVTWLWDGADGALPELPRAERERRRAREEREERERREHEARHRGVHEWRDRNALPEDSRRFRDRRGAQFQQHPARDARRMHARDETEASGRGSVRPRGSVFSRLGNVAGGGVGKARARGGVGGAVTPAAFGALVGRLGTAARDGDSDSDMGDDMLADAFGQESQDAAQAAQPLLPSADTVCIAPVGEAAPAAVVQAHFCAVGTVRRVTHTGRGYAWVQFADVASAGAAVAALNNSELAKALVEVVRKAEASELLRKAETAFAHYHCESSSWFPPNNAGLSSGWGAGRGRGRGRGQGRGRGRGPGRGYGRGFTIARPKAPLVWRREGAPAP